MAAELRLVQASITTTASITEIRAAEWAVREAIERMEASSASGEPDDGAVLNYEMAINDLLAAKERAQF